MTPDFGGRNARLGAAALESLCDLTLARQPLPKGPPRVDVSAEDTRHLRRHSREHGIDPMAGPKGLAPQGWHGSVRLGRPGAAHGARSVSDCRQNLHRAGESTHVEDPDFPPLTASVWACSALVVVLDLVLLRATCSAAPWCAM